MKARNANAVVAAQQDAGGIESLRNRPGISPDELLASNVFKVSRNGLYAAINRGDIESFRFGKKIIIPTAPLLRKLGIAS
jgi:hypothetical protein